MEDLMNSIRNILNQIKPLIINNWKYIACYSAGSFISSLFAIRFAYKLSGCENYKQFLFSIYLKYASQKYNTIPSKWRLSKYVPIRPSSTLCVYDQMYYDFCNGGDPVARQKYIERPVGEKVLEFKGFSDKSMFEMNSTCLGFGNNHNLINKYIKEITINGFRSLKINYPGTEKETKTLILGVHGGSNVAGAPEMMRAYLVLLSKMVNATCYSIGHGLAPEYVAPKQVDHIIDAYKWILNKHKDDKIANVYFSGHSAGGTAMLLTLQKLLTMKKEIRYPDGGISLSAAVDRQFEGGSNITNMDRDCYPDWEMLYDIENFAVGNVDMDGKWKSDEEKVDLRSADISPLYGQVKGLCDLYVFVGLNEKLCSFNEDFIKKCKENNVDVEFEINEWLPHDGPLMCDSVVEARDSVVRIAQWIKKKDA